MAWITKNSATMPVERRDAPYLDAQLAARLEADVMSCYPTRQAAALPVLHALQKQHGWLCHQAIEEAAAFLQQSPAQLLDTVSFYEEFWLEPKGRYVVWLCQSLTCELMGQRLLLDRIKLKLGAEVGQTTEDGKFTLMTVECLGACGTAPCALVNEQLHENLTVNNLDQLLDELP